MAVIKSRGPGISPGYYECGPRLLLLENRRKIEPKEIPSCLIPRLLVVFIRQLEILVTTLNNNNNNIKKISERATMTEIQKICMLGSVRILRRVLSV